MIHYLYYGACVVLLFGAAIFVHEFGHYWMARRRGLKVLAFAIGFGPKIFSWTRHGIEYSVRWIPAGGFVKLPQMVTGPLEGESKADDVPPAAPFSKILVAAAGPFMNVAFALAIACLIYWIGLPVPVNPSIIGYVKPDSPEGQLGIQEGDRIVAVFGRPVKSWDEVNSMTVVALTNVLPVAIEHDGHTTTYNLRAEVNPLLQVKMLDLEPMEHWMVDRITEGSAGEAARMEPGDEVVSFGGAPISSFEQLTNLIQKRGAQETVIVLKRGQTLTNLSVTPKLDSSTKTFKLGVAFRPPPDMYIVEHPTPWLQVQNVLTQIVGTISALTHPHESGVHVSELSGPVGILGFLAAEVKTDFRRALEFLVLLNINLAIINLLPVPVLDGGHILMAIVEKIRRRPLGLQFVEYTTTTFAVLLISFMLYVTFFDLKRLPLLRYVLSQKSQIEHVEKPSSPDSASPIPAAP
jgi:regulator of sigma E protease